MDKAEGKRSGRQVDGRRECHLYFVCRSPPPVLSAGCEWHLTSQLFSPHALDSSPDHRVRLGLRS
jgi:hypothetical protein